MGTKPYGIEDAKTEIVAIQALAVNGYVLPSFTTAARDLIAAPATGLTIYNSTTGKINFYDGGAWRAVTST